LANCERCLAVLLDNGFAPAVAARAMPRWRVTCWARFRVRLIVAGLEQLAE